MKNSTLIEKIQEDFKQDLMNLSVSLNIEEIGQATEKMKKRLDVLKRHPFHVVQQSDGRWSTYIINESGERKRIRKKTREELLDYLTELYKEEVATLDDYYKRAIEDRRKRGHGNNAVRMQAEYRRFLEGNSLLSRPVEALKASEILNALLV